MILQSREPFQNSRIDLLAQAFIEAAGISPVDYLFICPYSIGDFYHTLVLMDAFRARYCVAGQRIHFVSSKRCVSLAGIFNNIDHCVGVDCNPHFLALEAFAQRYQIGPGVPIVPEPDMHSRGWLSRIVVTGKMTQIEAKKLMLELDINAPLAIPRLDESQRSQINAKAASQGLKPGSVIIFNHAKTAAPIDPEIFRVLTPSFGDNIFYDATGDAAGSVPWAKPLEIPLSDIPYYAEYAGSVVAVRSGIVDVLAFTQCNLLTVYPNAEMVNSWWQDREFGAKLIRAARLDHLGIRTHRPEFQLLAENGDDKTALMQKMATLVDQFV